MASSPLRPRHEFRTTITERRWTQTCRHCGFARSSDGKTIAMRTGLPDPCNTHEDCRKHPELAIRCAAARACFAPEEVDEALAALCLAG